MFFASGTNFWTKLRLAGLLGPCMADVFAHFVFPWPLPIYSYISIWDSVLGHNSNVRDTPQMLDDMLARECLSWVYTAMWAVACCGILTRRTFCAVSHGGLAHAVYVCTPHPSPTLFVLLSRSQRRGREGVRQASVATRERLADYKVSSVPTAACMRSRHAKRSAGLQSVVAAWYELVGTFKRRSTCPQLSLFRAPALQHIYFDHQRSSSLTGCS